MKIKNSQEGLSFKLNEVPVFKKEWTTPNIEVISRDVIANGTFFQIHEASAQLPQFISKYVS